MTTYEKILKYNRDPDLSPWFKERLLDLIGYGLYHNNVAECSRNIVSYLFKYAKDTNTNTVAIGMSGGIDSALTASLFKAAGYRVIGVTLPIYQKPEETARGIEACEALAIEHQQRDLTGLFDQAFDYFSSQDKTLTASDHKSKLRAGNIRARLRMMNLYDIASANNGFVASTDNFSELAAGFWTLHGDVGDVAPIQSLTKSWEVPAMAEHMAVPESIIKAVPTDGLGISSSDEDQFGFSYLHFDVVLLSLLDGTNLRPEDVQDHKIVEDVKQKITNTIYKRTNPLNLPHPLYPERFEKMEQLDKLLRR